MACQANVKTALRPWSGEFVGTGGIVSRIWANLLAWQGRKFDRNHMESLNDHLLRDIGLSRADIDRFLN